MVTKYKTGPIHFHWDNHERIIKFISTGICINVILRINYSGFELPCEFLYLYFSNIIFLNEPGKSKSDYR
jgi:hypothetical protein